MAEEAALLAAPVVDYNCAAALPGDDVACLMLYLRCIANAIDFAGVLPDRFTAVEARSTLTQEEEQAVVACAMTFNPFATKELRDVIVMLDDPESRSPRYVELEDAAAAPELRICPVHWVIVQGKRLRVRRVMVYPLSWLDRVLLQPAKRQAHTVQACANGHRSGSTAVTAASMVAQCGGYGSTLQRARSVPGPVSERSTASSLLLSTRDCSIKQPSHSGFNYRSSAHRVVDRAMTLLCVCFILVAAGALVQLILWVASSSSVWDPELRDLDDDFGDQLRDKSALFVYILALVGAVCSIAVGCCVVRFYRMGRSERLELSRSRCLQLVVLSSLGVLCFSYVYLPGLGGATRRRAEAWGWQQWLVLLLPLGCVATCLVAFWRLCHHARAPSPADGCCSAVV